MAQLRTFQWDCLGLKKNQHRDEKRIAHQNLLYAIKWKFLFRVSVVDNVLQMKWVTFAVAEFNKATKTGRKRTETASNAAKMDEINDQMTMLLT